METAPRLDAEPTPAQGLRLSIDQLASDGTLWRIDDRLSEAEMWLLVNLIRLGRISVLRKWHCGSSMLEIRKRR
jgi:hypothetical protein